jgi:hypothetical protein
MLIHAGHPEPSRAGRTDLTGTCDDG